MAEQARVIGSELARWVLEVEASALRRTAENVGREFDQALAILHVTVCRRGTVFVSGVGKSGHVAAHIAAKLSATGTPAEFVHPVEALHGDMGKIRQGDTIVLISRSGACDEVIRFGKTVRRRFEFPALEMIALTADSESEMARLADVVLDCSVDREACPVGLLPTASTIVAQAVGDALAVCSMHRRGLSADDFLETHPGGAIGAGATAT